MRRPYLVEFHIGFGKGFQLFVADLRLLAGPWLLRFFLRSDHRQGGEGQPDRQSKYEGYGQILFHHKTSLAQFKFITARFTPFLFSRARQTAFPSSYVRALRRMTWQ